MKLGDGFHVTFIVTLSLSVGLFSVLAFGDVFKEQKTIRLHFTKALADTECPETAITDERAKSTVTVGGQEMTGKEAFAQFCKNHKWVTTGDGGEVAASGPCEPTATDVIVVKFNAPQNDSSYDIVVVDNAANRKNIEELQKDESNNIASVSTVPGWTCGCSANTSEAPTEDEPGPETPETPNNPDGGSPTLPDPGTSGA